MVKKESNMENETKEVRINSLEDLINLNLRTLEGVICDNIDNRKAGVIFTGSRTIVASLKLGLDAVRLGVNRLDGVLLGSNNKLSLSSPVPPSNK